MEGVEDPAGLCLFCHPDRDKGIRGGRMIRVSHIHLHSEVNEANECTRMQRKHAELDFISLDLKLGQVRDEKCEQIENKYIYQFASRT